jgi:hypothetical protein
VTTAVVALAATTALLAVMLVVTLRQLGIFMREWSAERRVLVDRAIAKDYGEVIAMDRAARPPKDREPPKLVEGLS